MKVKSQIPKQLLSIALCVALVLICVPFTAFASETDNAVYNIYFMLDTYTSAAPVNHGMSFTEMYPNVDPDKDLVPQKDNHTFIGWYESTDDGETFMDTPYDFSSEVTGDVTLYPLFEIAVYDIYFVLDTYTSAAPVNHGMSFTEMYPNVDPAKDLVPQKDNHTFIGWYESTDDGETFMDTPYDFSSEVTGDVTLYPLFEIAVYDIYFVLDTYTSAAPVNHGMSFTEMYPNVDPAKDLVPQKDNHTFIGWYESTDDGETFMDTPYDFSSEVTGDVTLYPLFEIFTYTVKIPSEQVGYKLEADVSEIEHGGDVMISISLADGYKKTDSFAVKVNGEKVELTEDNNVVLTGVDGDVEIMVEGVAIKTYTVTYKADGEVVATVEVEHGKDAAAPEIPQKDGCNAAWDKDGKNITADIEINAVYTGIPATGDNTDFWIWFALLFISGGAIFGIALNERKRRS